MIRAFKFATVMWLVSLFISFTAVAQSENGNNDIADVIQITGTRIAQPLREVGSSIGVITADDIVLMGYRNAIDAIASVPGVTVNQNGSFGAVATVRIRGALSEQTLVLIDGVPVNDPTSPGGGFDFARLDTSNIEKIEVLKGNQSTLWGSDAIGGVVNIVTKRADNTSAKVFSEIGSFSTYRGGVEANIAKEGFSARLSFNGITSNGISKAEKKDGNNERDGFDSKTFSANTSLSLPHNATLLSSVLYNDSKLEYDGYGVKTGVADSDVATETEEIAASMTLKIPLLNGLYENSFNMSYSDTERDYFSNGSPAYDYAGHRLLFRYQGTLNFNDKNRLAFGAEHETSQSGTDDNEIQGYFTLYEFKPLKATTLSAAVRIDDHDVYGSKTTTKFTAAWNPTVFATLRGSWGEGFKAPTIFQLTYFNPWSSKTQANKNLQPETSTSYDLGVDLNFEKAKISVTYFDQDTKNQIIYANGWYENESVVNSDGVEVSAQYDMLKILSISADYAYIDAKTGTNTQLLSVPKNSADFTISFKPSQRSSSSILVRYNGKEKNTNGNVKSWTRVDVNTNYRITERLSAFAKVENLFDENYQQVYGYGTPGISGLVGVSLTLQ
jgi:vitamin B12 transporter